MHKKTANRDLGMEALEALRNQDRAAGERIKAEMCEEAARNFVKEIELINSAFYRAWCDWDALENLKKNRPQ
jgi:hypothetical protein